MEEHPVLLLKKQLCIHPCETKKNLTFDIPVETDMAEAIIEMTYAPKFITDDATRQRLTLEGSIKWGFVPSDTKQIPLSQCPTDLCNMLTVSLDVNGKFRGYAHRHAPEQRIVIGRDEAEPGFYKGIVEKGIWRVTIAVCYVGTERCDCALTVSGIPMEEKAVEA